MFIVFLVRLIFFFWCYFFALFVFAFGCISFRRNLSILSIKEALPPLFLFSPSHLLHPPFFLPPDRWFSVLYTKQQRATKKTFKKKQAPKKKKLLNCSRPDPFPAPPLLLTPALLNSTLSPPLSYYYYSFLPYVIKQPQQDSPYLTLTIAEMIHESSIKNAMGPTK